MFTLKRSGCVVQVVHLRTFKLCCFVFCTIPDTSTHTTCRTRYGMTDDSTLYSLGSWYWSTTTLTLLFIVYLFASPP